MGPQSRGSPKCWNFETPTWESRCRKPTLKSVRMKLTLPKDMNLESSGTSKNLELDCRGQNTLHWGVLHTVGNVLKRKCPKWPRMSHLDIYNISYGRKKGQESNWQFDSWPLKVGNRLGPGMCRWSATCCWKALEESYKFALNLISIGGRGEKLWAPKALGVQTKIVSGLHFGSLGKKCHSDASAVE
jgi:hypothetical protein